MRVHHLNCGTLLPYGARLIDGAGGLLDRARRVCHCLLIETGQGLVLVDTGIGTAAVEAPLRWLGLPFVAAVRPTLDLEETALRQVIRLGYAAGDVRHVVLTHLDPDHAGGLRDFPQATVHVHRTELRAARARSGVLDRGRYRPAQWAHGPDWVTYDPTEGERWFGFAAVRQLRGLPAEILLVPLGGHSRGHSGVAVERDAGRAGPPASWLLHAGDAYFFHGEVHPERPWSTPALRLAQRITHADGRLRHHNAARLRELAATRPDRVEIVCAHDADEFDRCQGRRYAGQPT